MTKLDWQSLEVKQYGKNERSDYFHVGDASVVYTPGEPNNKFCCLKCLLPNCDHVKRLQRGLKDAEA